MTFFTSLEKGVKITLENIRQRNQLLGCGITVSALYLTERAGAESNPLKL